MPRHLLFQVLPSDFVKPWARSYWKNVSCREGCSVSLNQQNSLESQFSNVFLFRKITNQVKVNSFLRITYFLQELFQVIFIKLAWLTFLYCTGAWKLAGNVAKNSFTLRYCNGGFPTVIWRCRNLERNRKQK